MKKGTIMSTLIEEIIRMMNKNKGQNLAFTWKGEIKRYFGF